MSEISKLQAHVLELKKEIAALKAEVERLNQALRERLDEINPTGAGTSVSFFYCAAQAYKIELAREKEITAMLREALEDVERQCNDSSVVCRKCGDEETLQDSDIAYSVRDALAREAEMRKSR